MGVIVRHLPVLQVPLLQPHMSQQCPMLPKEAVLTSDTHPIC